MATATTMIESIKEVSSNIMRLWVSEYHIYFLLKGLLPRPDSSINNSPLPMPEFKGKDTWSVKKATFGQNDYIDILGDGSVHPVDLIRGPRWLVGFRGNELQRLIRRMKFEGQELRAKDQNKFHEMNKRIKWLMWRFNHKFGGKKK